MCVEWVPRQQLLWSFFQGAVNYPAQVLATRFRSCGKSVSTLDCQTSSPVPSYLWERVSCWPWSWPTGLTGWPVRIGCCCSWLLYRCQGPYSGPWLHDKNGIEPAIQFSRVCVCVCVQIGLQLNKSWPGTSDSLVFPPKYWGAAMPSFLEAGTVSQLMECLSNLFNSRYF